MRLRSTRRSRSSPTSQFATCRWCRPTILQPPTLPVWRFSVDEYLRMIDAGILKHGEQCELLEGLIVPKMTRNARHDLALEMYRRASDHGRAAYEKAPNDLNNAMGYCVSLRNLSSGAETAALLVRLTRTTCLSGS